MIVAISDRNEFVGARFDLRDVTEGEAVLILSPRATDEVSYRAMPSIAYLDLSGLARDSMSSQTRTLFLVDQVQFTETGAAPG